MTEDFTPKGYTALLSTLLDHGYIVRDFTGADPEQSDLLLRHDLDMSLQAAVEIGLLEQKLGVQATYFVLLSTEMYNPFSAAGRQALAALQDQGHRIGLHFDATVYPGTFDDLEAAASTECKTLESILENPVEIISFHRPAREMLGREGTFAGRRHAYEPVFFDRMGYCSDSRGGWHHGHPTEHPAVHEKRALQLLTHPIWWIASDDEDVQRKLDRFAADREDTLRQELARNCQSYRYVPSPTPGHKAK